MYLKLQQLYLIFTISLINVKMSIIQMSKIVDTCTCIYYSTLQYYPLFTPIQHLTASFIRFLTPFQPLTACTLSLYHTLLSDPYPFNTALSLPYPFTTPHRLLLTTMQHLTAHYLSFSTP